MKKSMYKQVGFFFISEIMVSKVGLLRGFFFVLPPSFFYFLCFAFLFSCSGIVSCGVTENFSARQSVGNCTDGNWRSGIILCVM